PYRDQRRHPSQPRRPGTSMTAARVETSAEDGLMHIALSGEIDLANAAAVEDELRAAVSHQPTTVSVDLTDLTYMDSAGVRILFGLASRLQALRIVLELIVPLDSPTRRLIELSGFESLASLRPGRH
ncbi:MAG: STAS domain-containing protein, partial [Nocardioidaceae bacterium]